MKFLKTQNTSRYGITDNKFRVNPYGRYIMDGTGALRLPKGTTAERPQLSGVSTPEGANGYIRYNTTIDAVTGQQIGLEAYINGVWEVVRAPGAATITKQTLGPGDYVDDVFGPLSIVPAAADNILVFVENIFQISTTNFLLEQNTTAGTGAEIAATSMVSGTEYVIVTPGSTDFTLVGAGWETAGSFTVGVSYTIKIAGTTDFTLIGATDNNPGTVFTATDSGTGTGKALPATYSQAAGDVFIYDDSNGVAIGDGEVRETGYYLRFQEPVPLDKYVTVYFGFTN